MPREFELVEVSCMPKGQPKYEVAYKPGAMHRLLCEDTVLYIYISPEQELIMIRDSELCPSCGGTGVCTTCKGSGRVTCPECNGFGKKRLLGFIPKTCTTCGGSGLTTCRNCNGKGVCPDCMGRRYKTPKTTARE